MRPGFFNRPSAGEYPLSHYSPLRMFVSPTPLVCRFFELSPPSFIVSMRTHEEILSGIRPINVPGFISASVAAATALFKWLVSTLPSVAPGQEGEAIRTARQAVAVAPNSAVAWEALGYSYC